MVTAALILVATIAACGIMTYPLRAQTEVEDDAVAIYREQPICLHGATTADLDRLPGIATGTARRLVDIVAARPTWTIDDVADSLCLTVEQRLILLLCTSVDCRRSVFHGVFAARATHRVDAPRGSRDSLWLGPPLDAVQRLDLRWDQWRLFATASRAVGEAPAYQWYGGMLQGSFAGWSVTLGDFRPSVGLGLVLGRTGRGSRPSDVDMAGIVRPWTSSSRYGALRGAATTRVDSAGGATITTTVFAGRRSFASTRDSAGRVTAIRREGIIQTTDDATRPHVREDAAGMIAGITAAAWSTTLYGFLLGYDHHIASRAAWALTGTGGLAVGATASFHGWNDLSALADFARSPTGGVAVMANVDWSAPGRSRLILRGRYISADYRAPYGNAETDATAVANEAGLGFGWYGIRTGTWRLDATMDIRQSLARTFGTPAIVRGLTADVAGRVRLASRTTGTWRLSMDVEDDGLRPDGVGRTLAIPRQRLRGRMAVQRQWTPMVAVFGRLDAVRCSWEYGRSVETGMAATAGFRWTLAAWGIGGQWTVHRAPSAESAAYTTVALAPGTLASTIMTGNGSRMSLRATADVLPWLSVTAAWQSTVSVSRQSLGSGAMETSGPLDRRITLHVTARLHHEPSVDLPRRIAVDDEAGTRLE